MATSSGGSAVEIEARYLGQDERKMLKFFLYAAAKQATLHETEELLGSWRKAEIGDKITIRVTGRFAEENKLMGEQTYGTGSAKGKSAGPGKSLM